MAWTIAKRNYKGNGNLDGIPKVIEKVKLDPKEKEQLAAEVPIDWLGLQANAPKMGFWQVGAT